MRDFTSPTNGRAALSRQKTVARPITFEGVGLHCGLPVLCVVRPGAVDQGIVFQRTDVEGPAARVPALWQNVYETPLCTSIRNDDGVVVQTIEHLMAALAGAEIDNAVIELDGPEVPVMDGSAEPFVAAFDTHGVVSQDAPKRVIRVLKPIAIDADGANVRLAPSDRFVVEFEIDFDAPAIGRQRKTVTLVNGTFRRELSAARTFGMLEDVERMQAAGLALGGSLDNAIVVDRDAVLNADGLRYDDEFVRHKMLDSVGDLYLAGAQIVGAFHGHRSSHAMTCRLLDCLLSDSAAWDYAFVDDATGALVPAAPSAA